MAWLDPSWVVAYNANDSEEAVSDPCEDGDTISIVPEGTGHADSTPDADAGWSWYFDEDYFSAGYDSGDFSANAPKNADFAAQFATPKTDGFTLVWIGQADGFAGESILGGVKEQGGSQVEIRWATDGDIGILLGAASAFSTSQPLSANTTHLIVIFCHKTSAAQGWIEVDGTNVLGTTVAATALTNDDLDRVDLSSYGAHQAGNFHAFGYIAGEITSGDLSTVESYWNTVKGSGAAGGIVTPRLRAAHRAALVR